MTFNVEKGPFKFQKVSLPCEGGHPSPTPPRLVASLPHFVPPPPPPVKKILATPVLADYSRSHENIRHFQTRRSLANYNYYLKRHAQSSLL